MSDLQGRRIPGEEGSGRRSRWIWLVLGLILLLLLAALIPFACQALNGGSGQSGGSGAQGDAGQNADEQGSGADGQAQSAGAQGDQTQGDQAQDGGASGARSGEPQQVPTARLSVRDQNGAGGAVTVPAATVEGTEGWLAVRADEGGRPGEVLGRAPLRSGTNEDVRVELREPLDSSQRLYTTIHTERPADGSFTYPDGDPTLERNGNTVAQPFSYALSGATSDEAANNAAAQGGGIRGDELPESGGVPPGVLLAAGAFLLLSSAAVLASLRRFARR